MFAPKSEKTIPSCLWGLSTRQINIPRMTMGPFVLHLEV